MKHVLPAILALGLLTPSLCAAPLDSLEVRGDIGKPRLWTLAQLQKLTPVQTIRTTLKGKPFVARGVRLWSLIEAAAPRLDAKALRSEVRGSGAW